MARSAWESRPHAQKWRFLHRPRLSMKWIIVVYLYPVGSRGRVSIPASAVVISDVHSLWSKYKLTPFALERTRSFTDRASWRTVNQATVKKKKRMMREIRKVAKKKLPSTKWTGDRVEEEGRGITSSSVKASTDRPSDLRVPGLRVGSLGPLEGPAGTVWGVGGMGSSGLFLFPMSECVRETVRQKLAGGGVYGDWERGERRLKVVDRTGQNGIGRT